MRVTFRTGAEALEAMRDARRELAARQAAGDLAAGYSPHQVEELASWIEPGVRFELTALGRVALGDQPHVELLADTGDYVPIFFLP